MMINRFIILIHLLCTINSVASLSSFDRAKDALRRRDFVRTICQQLDAQECSLPIKIPPLTTEMPVVTGNVNAGNLMGENWTLVRRLAIPSDLKEVEERVKHSLCIQKRRRTAVAHMSIRMPQKRKFSIRFLDF